MDVLILFCKTETGNFLSGMLLNHNLKSLWTLSASIFSHNCSSRGIQLVIKWQFWRNTHSPFCIATCIIFSALGPCPCPRLMALNFFLIIMESAKLNKSFIGSDPGLSTNTNAVVTVDGRNDSGKSNGGGSINRCPIFSVTKSCKNVLATLPSRQGKLQKRSFHSSTRNRCLESGQT